MILGGIVGGYYGMDGDGGGGANPVIYYYGKDQTRRVGQNYTPGGSGSSRPAEFKTTANEVYDGGQADLLTITNASDATDIDISNAPNNTILQFPISRYHLYFQGYTEAAFVSNFRVELRKIQSGTDDVLITDVAGYAGSVNPARTTYELVWPDFVVTDETDKFYLLFPSGAASKRSHFLRIEKVA